MRGGTCTVNVHDCAWTFKTVSLHGTEYILVPFKASKSSLKNGIKMHY